MSTMNAWHNGRGNLHPNEEAKNKKNNNKKKNSSDSELNTSRL